MIAKVIAYGPHPREALARLRRALDRHDRRRRGRHDEQVLPARPARPARGDQRQRRHRLDRPRARPRRPGQPPRGRRRARRRRHRRLRRGRARPSAPASSSTAHGGRPEARHEVGRAFDLKLRGSTHRVEVAQVGAAPLPGRPSTGAAVDAAVEPLQRPRPAGSPSRAARTGVVTAAHAADHLVEVDGIVHRVTKDEGGVLRAPRPRSSSSVTSRSATRSPPARPSSCSSRMKMETVLPAPFAGRVRELLVAANDQVGRRRAAAAAGAAVGDGAAAAPRTAARSTLPTRALVVDAQAPRAAPARRPREHAARVRRAPGRRPPRRRAVPAVRAELGAERSTAGRAARRRARRPDRLRRPVRAQPQPAARRGGRRDERVHSPREYFHAYLHSLDVDRERLPEAFRGKLRARARALRRRRARPHARPGGGGLPGLPLPAAHRRATCPSSTALLQRWLGDEAPADGVAERAREVLDRLVLATQLRFPAVGDLARSARFRWFEAPIVEAAREEATPGSATSWRTCRSTRTPPTTRTGSRRWSPAPSRSSGSSPSGIAGGVPAREPLVEVLAHRHYQAHEPRARRRGRRRARGAAVRRRRLRDPRRAAPGWWPRSRRSRSCRRCGDRARRSSSRRPGRRRRRGGPVPVLAATRPTAPDAAARALRRRAAAALPFVPRLRRIAVAGVRRGAGSQVAAVHVPARPARPHRRGGRGRARPRDAPDGRPAARPVAAARLHADPAAAPEDVLLFHCVAPGNESDQRLVALPRSASCRSCGTPGPRRRRCRRPSGRCRAAWTPSAGPGPPCPAARGST